MDDQRTSTWGTLHVPRRQLGQLEAFDQGGEGVLYRVPALTGPEGRPLLFKEYRPESVAALDTDALERGAQFARSVSEDTFRWLYQRAAWPTWIVDDGGSPLVGPQAVGVLIPEAAPRFMARLPRSAGGSRTVPAKFELLLNGGPFLDRLGIEISLRQRIELLTSVADTLAFLHAHSIAVGDFSCKNILFALRPVPSSFLIDCDSMLWDGSGALPPGETPEWEMADGEQQGTPAADVYKFALLVLRMHTGAQHHRNPARLPPGTWGPLRQLVELTLSGPPPQRPLITDWIGVLAAASAAAPTEPVGRQVGGRAPVRMVTARTPTRGGSLLPSPATAQPADHRADEDSLLPSGPVADFVVVVLRRLLVRKPANPSLARLAVMLLGLWAACGIAVGLAVVAGADLEHMSHFGEFLLFGTFALLALAAFALVTTEPQ
jgi:hypothetical protein